MNKTSDSVMNNDDPAAKCRRQIICATIVGIVIIIVLWRLGVWLGVVEK
jgi:hypothetical protein